MEFKNRRELIKHLKTLNFKVGIEVGVRLGHFSKFMLDHTDMTVYSIDPWEHNAELNKPEYSYQYTVSLLQKYGEKSKLIKGYSPEVCEQFQDNSVDFVYIDGLHTYDAVKKDINGWYSKVKTGGIIAGHDYSKKHWVGVYNAVNEFIKTHNIKLNITGVGGFKTREQRKAQEYDGNQPSWWFIKE